MILVFGGRGQLAQELVKFATERGLPLVALGHSETDIAEAGEVAAAIDRVRPSFIVNAAAYNDVDKAEADVAAAARANTMGPAVLAAAADARNVPFVHISTDYVFDGNKSGAWREYDPVRPLSVYGRTKADGEARVRSISARHLILRTAWLFGTNGANFVKTTLRLAAERDALEVVADTRGSPTSTDDLAHAIFHAIAAIQQGATDWGTYHVAGEGAASRYQQAIAIVAAQAPFTGRRPKVNPVSSESFRAAALRPRNSELDSGKFAATFGFRPAPWNVAIERVVQNIFAPERVA